MVEDEGGVLQFASRMRIDSCGEQDEACVVFEDRYASAEESLRATNAPGHGVGAHMWDRGLKPRKTLNQAEKPADIGGLFIAASI